MPLTWRASPTIRTAPTLPRPCPERQPRPTTELPGNPNGLQGEQEPDDGPSRAALPARAAPRTGDHHPALPPKSLQPARHQRPGGRPEGREPRLHRQLPRGEDALPARIPRAPPPRAEGGRQATLRGLLHVR